jgi:hypothetical protein
MARLHSFFGLNEMARPKGSIDAKTKAALEMARQHGGEFTVKQFCQWLADAGANNPSVASVGTRLGRMYAPAGERPDALRPLVRASDFRTGPGGAGSYVYAYDGPPGYVKKDPNAPEAEPEDELEQEPEDSEAPPQEAPRQPPPRWVPKADANGDWTEEAMAELEAADLGPDHPMWRAVGEAENDIAVAKIFGAESIPPQFQRKAKRVAQKIFANLGRDWETGNAAQARPANPSAGDRKYGKGVSPVPLGKQGAAAQAKAADDKMAALLAAMSKPPQVAPDDVDDYDDDDNFIEPDDEPADEPEATQAGASQFLKPASPTPPPAQAAKGGPAPPPSASRGPTAKNMSQLMKRFKK